MTRIWQHSNKMMSKFLFFILYSLFFITLTGCETHSSDNGDLDNWWYLRQVDNLTDGTNTDYIEKKVFWSYIGAMMQTEGGGKYQYQDGNGRTRSATCARMLFRFEHQGNTLRVYEPRYHSKGIHDAELDPTVEADKIIIGHALPVQGINLKERSNGKLEETFTVEELNSDRMTILNEDKTLRLHFVAW